MRFVLSALLLLSLTACIVVEDFGDYWEKGSSDPCIQAIARRTLLADSGDLNAEPAQQVRSLRVGGADFMMLRANPSDRGGALYRYAVENDQYIGYRLNEEKREEFLQAHPHAQAVIVTEETATIPLLNAQSLVLISEIAAKPDYWVASERLPYNPTRRKDCPAGNAEK